MKLKFLSWGIAVDAMADESIYALRQNGHMGFFVSGVSSEYPEP
jgi:hypothetical protein